MQDLPDALDLAALPPALRRGWGIEAVTIDYAPVGFGSYHWTVTGRDGARHFVTVDDLDRKPWLGTNREAALAGLGTAYGTAIALRAECGLDFVVAPVPTDLGRPVERLNERYTLAVFPLLDGQAGGFGDDRAPALREDLVRALAQLHGALPRSVLLRADVPLAGRPALERALRELERPWDGGPFSEPARRWLTDHAPVVQQALDRLDELVGLTAQLPRVVTHGEPHAGNVLLVGGRSLLIDWDTVALALPERDLWLAGGSDALEPYVAATGHVLSTDALELYRRAWDLADVASYVGEFRSPHGRTQDTQAAWGHLVGADWAERGP